MLICIIYHGHNWFVYINLPLRRFFSFLQNFLLLFTFTLHFFFQAEDGIRDIGVTGVQTCALPICKSFVLRWQDDVYDGDEEDGGDDDNDGDDNDNG